MRTSTFSSPMSEDASAHEELALETPFRGPNPAYVRSMKLRVSHLTRYEYGQEVYLSPHAVFLRPRETAQHRVAHFSFNVSPNAKLMHTRDPHDNALIWLHFWDRAQALSIRTEFEIETLGADPFDFILKTKVVNFPFYYYQAEQFALEPYLAPPFPETQNRLNNWLDEHLLDRPAETV